MYLLCLEIVLTEEGLTKKGKITGKVKGPEKISYNCNDAMLCASCKFCLVCSDNSSPVVNGCKEKALYTPVPCTRFLLNIESRNWAPMSHIIHLTNKAMRQEGIKPGILLSWCSDKVRAARSYRSQTADEGCCSPLEIGIAGKLPRNWFHVVSGYKIRIPIFRCYKSIKQRESLDVKHKK